MWLSENQDVALSNLKKFFALVSSGRLNNLPMFSEENFWSVLTFRSLLKAIDLSNLEVVDDLLTWEITTSTKELVP